ncbi:uncharacterized protein ATC70_006410 [Mucor velutinosus]|uniref:Uncharacterized protein n=1 Tax=Mucor velutinosus TaxID=708070 RepID=A0AAN7D4J9_9FUNG|nr:hypothetical protein ATC70_006410 [Mucor velutinosus]
MQQPANTTTQQQQEKQGLFPTLESALDTHLHDRNNNLLVNYKGVYHIDWKSHLYWTLAIVCFILARLWWLVPLPGDTLLPTYRTYPANFFNTLFLGFACSLATRSITVALVKPFEEGINPDSVVAFGATGGFGAMWSCIRYKSGIRYFLLAFLVTAATLLGNALEGELQSSMSIYYKLGATTDVNLAECQHTNANDYQAASLAYSSGHISHTISDASALLKNYAYQPSIKPYTVSLIKTSLEPVQNITLGSTTTAATGSAKLRRRHYRSKTCESAGNTQQQQTAITETTSSSEIAPTATTNASIASSIPSDTPAQQQQNNLAVGDTIILTLDGEQSVLNTTAAAFYSFDASRIFISKGANNLAVPYNSTSGSNNNTAASEIKLNVLRHTTSDDKQVIIIYSPASDGFAAGVYVSATAANYTCQSQLCNPVGDSAANNKVVADALAEAMRDGTGFYGTQGLVGNILNHDNLRDKGLLADALYTNPNCPQAVEIPTLGNRMYPYSAARWNLLSMLWVLGYIIIWLIGAYLIGYSEETWSQLARTGRMVPQIISNSANLFVDGINGKTVNQEAFLDPTTGKMAFAKEHNHGYSVTTAELSPL